MSVWFFGKVVLIVEVKGLGGLLRWWNVVMVWKGLVGGFLS